MNILESTYAYEHWLRRQTRLVEKDLDKKHKAMAKGKAGFAFLRATFYRWAQLFPELCPELASAPALMAVGDLHVENFGTWRDVEGRLVWGVNDFDEASVMPYTLDLVRLATSAMLAIREDNKIKCQPAAACDAILEGYAEGILKGGAPFVLAERNRWLRRLAMSEMREPDLFWQKIDDDLHPLDKPPPANVKQALLARAPRGAKDGILRHRRAGLGSLGRPRVTLLAHWHGARLAHEAKLLVTSAWNWARNTTSKARLCYQPILTQAVHVPDPCLEIRQNWVFRRLAADCSRIELDDLPDDRDETRLLAAMGKETANIHLGSQESLKEIKMDLVRRPHRWLVEAASTMAKVTVADWKEWKSH